MLNSRLIGLYYRCTYFGVSFFKITMKKSCCHINGVTLCVRALLLYTYFCFRLHLCNVQLRCLNSWSTMYIYIYIYIYIYHLEIETRRWHKPNITHGNNHICQHFYTLEDDFHSCLLV